MPVQRCHRASTNQHHARMLPAAMAQRSTRQRLGAAIRDRRELLRLTQEAAAERSNLSPRYWRSLEAGRPAAALEVVERVVAGLDWTWHDLVDALAPEPHERGAPGRVLRLLDEAWRRATPRERELVNATLQVLATGRRRGP